jgi:hypothetical protein
MNESCGSLDALKGMVHVVLIATNHLLAVASIMSTADDSRSWSGRSTSARSTARSQQSVLTSIITLNVSSDFR